MLWWGFSVHIHSSCSTGVSSLPTYFPHYFTWVLLSWFFYHTHFAWSLFSYQDRSQTIYSCVEGGYNAKQSPQGKVLMGEFLVLPELIEKKNVFRQAEKIKCGRLVQGWSSTKWLRQLKQKRIEAAGNETGDGKGTEADEIGRHYFPRQYQEGFLLECLIRATVII